MCRTSESDRDVSKDTRCGGNCPGMLTGNQAARSCARPQASFWQIWNMCCGFLGLQFGFALQNANVSRIFQTLGAPLEQVPLRGAPRDRKSTRLNSSHVAISYAVFC